MESPFIFSKLSSRSMNDKVTTFNRMLAFSVVVAAALLTVPIFAMPYLCRQLENWDS